MSQGTNAIGCLGNTIKVAAGHYVDLKNPDPAALSKICRFGAHCRRFYSVAEHLILATELATEDGHDLKTLQAIFLHDAAEAYIGDCVKPLKNMLPDYAEYERRMEDAVQAAFGINFSTYHDAIKKYDFIMLKAEKLAFWPDDKHEWTGFSDIEVRKVSFSYMNPIRAEKSFIGMAETLNLVSNWKG